jgi:D-glycerate 3-kinase
MSPLYEDVLAFCGAQLAQTPRRPLIIGIQGPQGAGKSTLTRALLEELPAHGLSGATVSVDDFYMTRAGQLAVAAAHPGNPYLEHRGYPGTHDVDLGADTLARLAGGEHGVRIPVYDKSAHGGRGDRAPVDAWRPAPASLDIVFVEGWMLGFTPVPEASIVDPHLIPANRALADYDRWHRHIDAWIVLRAVDPNYVLTWRVEAEERMKAAGKPGLSREDIEDYIRRFIPAYQTWGGAPKDVEADRQIEIRINLGRGAVEPPSRT